MGGRPQDGSPQGTEGHLHAIRLCHCQAGQGYRLLKLVPSLICHPVNALFAFCALCTHGEELAVALQNKRSLKANFLMAMTSLLSCFHLARAALRSGPV